MVFVNIYCFWHWNSYILIGFSCLILLNLIWIIFTYFVLLNLPKMTIFLLYGCILLHIVSFLLTLSFVALRLFTYEKKFIGKKTLNKFPHLYRLYCMETSIDSSMVFSSNSSLRNWNFNFKMTLDERETRDFIELVELWEMQTLMRLKRLGKLWNWKRWAPVNPSFGG